MSQQLIGCCFEKLHGRLESFGLEVFGAVLKPEWIPRVLEATGRESKRVRKLPAGFAVWLVIGMGLYRFLSIQNVLRRMGTLMGAGSLWGNEEIPTSASITAARDRLGFGPLRELFRYLCTWLVETHGEGMKWRSYPLLILDGTTFKVPDSSQNQKRFGLPGAKHGRAAFPQMRALFLVSAKFHFVLEALFAPYRRGEMDLARRILSSIPSGAMLLLDRGFFAWWFLWRLQQQNTQFLLRAPRSMRGAHRQRLGKGDYLVTFTPSRSARSAHPDLPVQWVLREITILVKGRAFRFVTSLTDPKIYPAVELAHLYLSRWEIETVFDEIKTHQGQSTVVNRPLLFRCQTSRRVFQEAFGLLLAYNLCRAVMAQTAAKHQVPALRISFVDSLEQIRIAAVLMAAAPTASLPTLFQDLLQTLSQRLIPVRSSRTNPRVVSIPRSPYPVKTKTRLIA